MQLVSFFPERAVFLSVGSFSVYWYGVMYFLAFVLALYILPRIQKHRSLTLTHDQWSQVLTATILGVLIGGRLGFVLLYEPELFLEPHKVLQVWNGGMSSHGGMIGVLLAGLYVYLRMGISFWKIADVATVPIALGLALGRIGNFINLELYGSVTTLAWGIEIPGVEGLRHPTQLYAVVKNIVITLVCFSLLKKTTTNGVVLASFFILYGIFRSLVEVFRIQPYGYWNIGSLSLSYGQLYSIPILLLGLSLFLYLHFSKK